MSDELISRAQRLFESVVDLPAFEQERALGSAGAEDPELERLVRELIASDASQRSFLSTPAMERHIEGLTTTDSAALRRGMDEESVPSQVGGYEIVRLIGEGGMGAVYEAMQDTPRRPVAVKVIRAGLVGRQVLARFKREAELLGRLQHPGIAAVYEAGTADITSQRGVVRDQPFYAMELVRGRPLLQYCLEERLETRGRMQLLAQVCDAVQHAHERGIVHRDLKPGNVLVEIGGQPKVLDFGIARAAADETMTLQTQTGQILGTVPYMSPEQVAGEHASVNARSDVYALGVIMFELLAGRLPYDLRNKPIAEAARIIRDHEPTRLSSARTSLRGDLDTIVAKALEKDPARRYQSAAELGDDLRRFLGDQPIMARPASSLYQFGKFARRNKALVGGVAATIIVLAVGVIATGLALGREAAQRKLAERNLGLAKASEEEARVAQKLAETRESEAIKARRRAEASAAFTRGILSAISPSKSFGRDTELLRETLKQASARVEEELSEYPDLKVEMLTTIGETYRNVAAFTEAIDPLRRASEIQRSISGEHSPETLTAVYTLAGVLRSAGMAKEAATLVDGTIEALRAQPSLEPATLANHVRLRADIAQDLGEMDRAISLAEESLRLAEASGEAGVICESRGILAGLRRRQGRLDEAKVLLGEVIEYLKQLGPDGAIRLGSALNSLAIVERFQNNLRGARDLYEEALAVRRNLYDRPHPDVAVVLVNLGKVYGDMADFDRAEPLLRESLEMHNAVYEGDHQGKAVAMDRLGTLLMQRGKFEEAETLLKEALRMFTATVGANHPFTATCTSSLGSLYLETERFAEAEANYRAAIEGMKKAFRANPELYVAPLLGLIGEALARMGRHEEAVASLNEAILMYAKVPNPNPGEIAWAKGTLARELLVLGNMEEALTMGKDAVDGIAGLPDRAREAQVRIFYADVLVAKGDFDAAEAQLKVAEKLAAEATQATASRRRAMAEKFAALYETWAGQQPTAAVSEKALQWRKRAEELNAEAAASRGQDPGTGAR
jgi:tetratricopeptide (TPR) repeat protein